MTPHLLRFAFSCVLSIALVSGCGSGDGGKDASAPDSSQPPFDLSVLDLRGAPAIDLTVGDASTIADESVPADATVDAAPACNACVDFTCCAGQCVNTDNDINNCGQCGTRCPGPTPFCNRGKCEAPPCGLGTACSGAEFCCNAQCCAAGQLCCEVPGPVSFPAMCTTPTALGTCPLGCKGCKCNAEGTLIAGPQGERPIESLVEGDLVYSVHQGRITAVRIARTNRVPAPNHVVARVQFEGGRTLYESPLHPTADGRTFGALRAGDRLSGLLVVEAHLEPYRGSATYDILPASDSGTYFASGVLIGSTLSPTTVTAPIVGLSPSP